METESERITRRKRVDPRLIAADWKIIKYTDGMDLSRYNRYALTEFPTNNLRRPANLSNCIVLELMKSGRIVQ